MHVVRVKKLFIGVIVVFIASVIGLVAASASSSESLREVSAISTKTVTQTLPKVTRLVTVEKTQTDTLTMTQTSMMTQTVSVTQTQTLQSSMIITKTQAAANIVWFIGGGVVIMMLGMIVFFLFGFRDGDDHNSRALKEIIKDLKKK